MNINETNDLTFIAGNRYSCNSIGDSNCWWHFEIVRRTAKSVWVREVGTDEITRRKIQRAMDGAEMVEPMGQYSFSPAIYANRNVNAGSAFPMQLVR